MTPPANVSTPGRTRQPRNRPAKGQEKKVDPQDYAALKIHALNGAQGQADGARLYADDARRAYLLRQEQFTGTSAWAARHITGPHPQHGSPDGG